MFYYKINIPLNPSNGKSKGFAFVEFETKLESLKAIHKLNNTDYKGRKIGLSSAVDNRLYTKPPKIQSSEQEDEKKETKEKFKKTINKNIDKSNELKRTIFIQNIHFTATEKDIFDHFKTIGFVVAAKVMLLVGP